MWGRKSPLPSRGRCMVKLDTSSHMSCCRFVIADHNLEGRFLLAKTLFRKFPDCIVLECATSAAALNAASDKVDIVIVHSTGDVSGPELVDMVRMIAPTVPVIGTSGNPNLKAAFVEAGATRFVESSEWPLMGAIVSDLLAEKRARAGRSALPVERPLAVIAS